MVLRILVALALLSSIALADDRPWAKGVPETRQQSALRQYEKANELFEKGEYKDALPAYLAALADWDHPGIHYNTAVCLINLDRSVEAYEHLQQAMVYGEAPLGKDLWKQAQTYNKMLSAQVGTLVVTVKQPGASVKLDGETLEIDPATGTAKRNLLATKPHQLVAEKGPQYEPATQTIELKPGATTTIELVLKLKTTGKLERRWSKWVPWAVVTAGGAIAIAGAPFLVRAKDNFEDYDRLFARDCSSGCLETARSQRLVDEESKASLQQTVAISAFIIGGAVIASGIALVVANQPRLLKPRVTPMVGEDRAGAVLTLDW